MNNINTNLQLLLLYLLILPFHLQFLNENNQFQYFWYSNQKQPFYYEKIAQTPHCRRLHDPHNSHDYASHLLSHHQFLKADPASEK